MEAHIQQRLVQVHKALCFVKHSYKRGSSRLEFESRDCVKAEIDNMHRLVSCLSMVSRCIIAATWHNFADLCEGSVVIFISVPTNKTYEFENVPRALDNCAKYSSP